MSVIARVGDAPTGRSNRRPTANCVTACTHIRMDRLYGSWSCDMCHYPSPFGWLYRCTEDIPEVGDYAFIKSFKNPVSHAGEHLRRAGLSESVIKQFEQGAYTDLQVQLLVRQKQHLQRVIQNLGLAQTASDQEAALVLRIDHPCGFKVCQHCRPMQKERCWTSFEAVFGDEIRPIDDYELNGGLPVKDARIVQRLGLHRPLSIIPTSPSGYSSDDFFTDDEYDDESCEDDVSASTHDAQDIFLTRHGGDMPFVTLGDARPTIRLVSSTSRRLRRIPATINDGSPSHSHTTSSSISLPTIPTTTSYTTLPESKEYIQSLEAQDEGTQVLKTQYSKEAMTDPEFYFGHPTFDTASVSSSEFSFGTEIAVESGVALTEEAMSTHTPDLFTRV